MILCGPLIISMGTQAKEMTYTGLQRPKLEVQLFGHKTTERKQSWKGTLSEIYCETLNHRIFGQLSSWLSRSIQQEKRDTLNLIKKDLSNKKWWWWLRNLVKVTQEPSFRKSYWRVYNICLLGNHRWACPQEDWVGIGNDLK